MLFFNTLAVKYYVPPPPLHRGSVCHGYKTTRTCFESEVITLRFFLPRLPLHSPALRWPAGAAAWGQRECRRKTTSPRCQGSKSWRPGLCTRWNRCPEPAQNLGSRNCTPSPRCCFMSCVCITMPIAEQAEIKCDKYY